MLSTMVMPNGETKIVKTFNSGNGYYLAKIRGTQDHCLYHPNGAQTTAIVEAREINDHIYVLTKSGSVYCTGPSKDIMSRIKLLAKYGKPTFETE